MVRKGIVAEIFSKAMYSDKPQSYIVGYIDRGTTKETTLDEFLKLSENFELIPATRIAYIKKENNILYSKIHKISQSF
ncbi:MAG: DUF504 domain-containing protein [Thaumarchaeota archaeon]|nr:DUF504 domain-containing protein [Nitrososphaerota archaeon]